jgi:hypothetical protein
MNILAEKHYLISRIDMKVLIIILNRIYSLLIILNNQSPLLGAIILVTLLLGSIILSALLGIFVFMDEALHIQGVTYFLIIFSVFAALYLFAKKNESKIIYHNTTRLRIKNILVFGLYVIAFGAFIVLSNINRKKFLKTEAYRLIRIKSSHLKVIYGIGFEH